MSSVIHLHAVVNPGGILPNDGRLEIRVDAGELPRMIGDALSVLATDQNLFQSGGDLVCVCSDPDRVGTRGVPRIRKMSEASTTKRLAELARWVKWRRGTGDDPGEWVGTYPDPHTVKAIVDQTSCGSWPTIRPLRGITEIPTLTPSGRIVSSEGYDEEIAMTLIPSIDVPPVPTISTKADAENALRFLWIELFCDYPYVGLGESDPEDTDRLARYEHARTVPDAFIGIAALLTIFARPAINGSVPGFVFEASAQGSGKTKQIHELALVATGRTAGVATFPVRDGKVDEAELEKVLSSYAIKGSQLIAFDNIKAMITGSALEKALTAVDTIDLRILGASEQRQMPWISVITFSGNNLAMSDDIRQRVLTSRLESSHEDPRSRDPSLFRHPDILQWIRDNRGDLIAACLTILQSAVMTGNARPHCGNWGSFESWATLVPQAIAWAGGPNVLEARPRIDATDDGEAASHSSLMAAWATSYQDGARIPDVIRVAYAREREILNGKDAPDGLEDLRSAFRELSNTPDNRVPTSSAVCKAMRRLEGKWRDGRKLVSERDRKGTLSWRVVSR